MTAKKTGRPTDNPKPHKLTVRLDNNGLQILDEYCAKNQITRMEGIRRGVNRLKDDLEKQKMAENDIITQQEIKKDERM